MIYRNILPNLSSVSTIQLFQNYAPQFYLQRKRNLSADKSGSDYARTGPIFLDDSESFTLDPTETSTHDNERMWDYFREDPLFHVFHSLLHKVTEKA